MVLKWNVEWLLKNKEKNFIKKKKAGLLTLKRWLE